MEFLSKEGLSYFWSKLKTRFDSLTSATNTNTSEIAVQKARIDSIATLPSGSTTADAELIDIRVKADGATATSAGNAVREQFADINHDISRLNELSYLKDNHSMPVSWFEHGNITYGVDDNYREGSRIRTKDILQFDSAAIISVSSGQFIVTYYNEDDTYSSLNGWYNPGTFVIPAGQKFRLLLTLNNSAPASQVDTIESILEKSELYVDSVCDVGYDLFDISFEHGSLNNGANDTYRQKARARSKNIINIPFPVAIYSTSGAYYVHFYDENGEFLSANGYRTTERTYIEANQRFRIIVTPDPHVDTFYTLESIVSNLRIEAEDFCSEFSSDIQLLSDYSYGNENYTLPTNLFERGNIDATGQNEDYRSSSRIRTKDILTFDSLVYIKGSSGFFVVYLYDDEGNYDGNSGWVNSSHFYVIPKGQRFRLILTLNSSASASDYYSVLDTCSNFYCYIDGQHKNISDPIDVEFEHGSLLNAEDDTYRQIARIRSSKVLDFPYTVSIKMDSGSYAIHYLDSEGIYQNNSGWLTGERLVPAHKKFRLVCCNDPNATEFSTIDSILNNLEITNASNFFGNSPNIIYQSRNVDDNLFPPYTKWYIEAAAQNQYDRVRFNVRKTTEGYFFLCHDDVINTEARNADGSSISSTISAKGRTLEELNSYDWGIKYGNYYAGAKVPMLEDALYYSSLFNLGVTIEVSSLDNWTDTDTSNLLWLFDKYGISDNLIIIDPSGNSISFLRKFIAHNKRISIYVGALPEWWSVQTNIDAAKSLLTEYNRVYIAIYPWGTLPTDEFIAMAKENGFTIYSSTSMSQSSLLNINMFNKGFGLIETNNVYAVKDTVRNWASSLVRTGITSN